jgi:predicted restriction endonuclease
MRNKKGQFIKGYKHSEESIKKIVSSLTGREVSEETKEKLRLSNKGKKHNLKHTEEWKKQNSIRHTGKVNSNKTRKKMSISKLGENNPNWKGGISPNNILIRMSLEYKLWRESVFKRDNYTCIWCGKKQGWDKKTKSQNIIQADHIKPFCDYPELRFAIDNGRTLCLECHKTTETYGAKKKK